MCIQTFNNLKYVDCMLAGGNNAIFGVNLTKNDAQTNNRLFPPNNVWGAIRTIFLGHARP